MTTTARGVPYPSDGDDNNAPVDLFAIAAWANDHPGVTTLTTTQRNALAGGDLWDGRIIYNTTTDRLEAYDLATTAWKKVMLQADVDAALVGYLQVLGRVELDNATPASISTASTSLVDVDATNLAVAFTVPTTGVVYVDLEAYAAGGTNYTWAIREAASVVAGSPRVVATSPGGGGNAFRIRTRIRVAGLTPGAAKTFKWAHAVTASSGQISYGGTDVAGRFGPATMEVFG